MAPHWPRPWGLDADPVAQLVIDDEMRRAGVRRPSNQIGIGWAGPTLGARRDRGPEESLSPAAVGRGGDLVPVVLRAWRGLGPGGAVDPGGARRRRVGGDGPEGVDEFRPRGRVWGSCSPAPIPTSKAPRASRTSCAPWTCPVSTIRPIVDMTGDHAFNEVFLDEVRLPAQNLVGEVNGGWALAKVTLGNERVSLSGEGARGGRGPPPATCSTSCGAAGARGTRGCASAWRACGPRARCCGSSGCARSAPLWPAGPRAPRPRCARPSPTTTGSG